MGPSAGSPGTSARERAGIAFVLAVALAARLFRLSSESLWFDEAFSVAAALRPSRELVDALIADARHPPLSFLVLKASLALFGRAPIELAARLPSVIASCVEVFLAWRLGRVLAGPRAALLGALLLALAQLSVRQAQEARMYALASCLVTGTALLTARALFDGRSRALVAAGFTAGLAVLTHYWSAFSIAALVGWAVVLHRRRALPVRSVVGAVAAFALVVTPWLAFAAVEQLDRALDLMAVGAPEWGRIGWRTLVAAPAVLAGGEQPRLGSPAPWALAAGWLLVLAPALSACFRGLRGAAPRGRRERALGLALLAFAPLAFSFATSAFAGAQFAIRYLLPALAPLLLLAASGLLELRPRALRLAAIAPALAFSVAGTATVWRGGWKPAWRALVTELAARAEPADCVLWLPAGRVPLQWDLYSPSRPPPRALSPALATPESCARIWLASFTPGPAWQPELERARRILAATHYPTLTSSWPTLTLELFERR